MAWWYEIRDADNRLMEVKRGFFTQVEAESVGQSAKQFILDISPDRELRVITGSDEWRPE
jgi:hypothetical protein